MPYCTLDDLRQALPEETLITLTDDDNLGVVDSARTDEAIATASAEIDGWCAGRYAVPFADPAPALIRKCAIDVAIYNLYSRRVETIPETRASRYKEAMRLLEKIAAGTITLGTTPAVAPVDDSSVATFAANSRWSTRTKLEGM